MSSDGGDTGRGNDWVRGLQSYFHSILVGDRDRRSYPYMSNLIALSSRVNHQALPLPPALSDIVTPLKVENWAVELSNYPDKQFSQYILAGIKHGFRVGFDYANCKLVARRRNMSSALEHSEIVDDYLAIEKAQGRVGVVPGDSAAAKACHISPFGVIPKKSKPGKWRLIIDLSTPTGHSVNDGIEKELCSLSYVSTDAVVECILRFQPGALLAKIDIKQAYRNIPVHPDDRPLLGMLWKDELLVDKVLPFGLRSAPIIFSAVADALQWAIEQSGVSHIFHYLDDFITVGPPHSNACRHNLEVITATCIRLGVPIEPGKTEGPATCITFLGMELDTYHRIIRLPEDKLARLRALLNDWSGRKAVKKRDLLSLIGYLHHASKAVRQGRSFLRRLIDLSMVVKHMDSYVRLNISARSDIRWWHLFAEQWNGTSMLYTFQRANPQIHVVSDASGSWGCGAYMDELWFQFQWPASMPDCHISVKEMVPVVMAAMVWGSRWEGLSVRFHCDNSAVVALLNAGAVRDDSLMHLMRCLAFVSAKFNFVVSSCHIRGNDNTLADALSRNNLPLFLRSRPQAQATPTPLPSALQELLLHQKPDWTSTRWTQLWTSIFNMQ